MIVVAISTQVAPASAQPYNLTVAGYSPGGLVSTAGAGLDAALNAAYPGSTLTYQTSSGGKRHAARTEQGAVGVHFRHRARRCNQGTGADQQASEGFPYSLPSLFAGLRFQATHVLTNKGWADKHGIASVADIAAKKPAMRIAVNRPGNLDGDIGLAVLSAVGVTQDMIKSWGGQVVRAASQEMTSLMLDRRLDVVIFGISMNHPRVQEMANGLDLARCSLSSKRSEKDHRRSRGQALCDRRPTNTNFSLWIRRPFLSECR